MVAETPEVDTLEAALGLSVLGVEVVAETPELVTFTPSCTSPDLSLFL